MSSSGDNSLYVFIGLLVGWTTGGIVFGFLIFLLSWHRRSHQTEIPVVHQV